MAPHTRTPPCIEGAANICHLFGKARYHHIINTSLLDFSIFRFFNDFHPLKSILLNDGFDLANNRFNNKLKEFTFGGVNIVGFNFPNFLNIQGAEATEYDLYFSEGLKAKDRHGLLDAFTLNVDPGKSEFNTYEVTYHIVKQDNASSIQALAPEWGKWVIINNNNNQ